MQDSKNVPSQLLFNIIMDYKGFKILFVKFFK